MTTLADRVVAHLRATRGQWRLTDDGELRRGNWCPLVSLSVDIHRPGRNDVMAAADNYIKGRRLVRNLRRRMLRAAGLAKEGHRG